MNLPDEFYDLMNSTIERTQFPATAFFCDQFEAGNFVNQQL